MDHELLVDNQVEDGRFLITELAESRFDVSIAFWARTSEEGLWYFYIGTTTLRQKTLADAYRVVYGILREIPNTKISIANLKLVVAEDLIARSAIEVRDRFAARVPTHYQGKRLGSLAIEEAYIYPRLGVMSRTEVLQTVTSLMDRTGGPAPSFVTMRDGSQMQAVPIGIHVNAPGDIQVVFQDLAASKNRSIPVDDVVGIR